MDCVSTGDNYNVENNTCHDWETCNSSNGGGGFGPPRKKAKPFRSNAWNYFVKIGVGQDGKGKCKCKACGQVYTYSGTSTLNRHILKCPMNSKSRNVGDMMTDNPEAENLGDMMTHNPEAENLGDRKLDQKVVRDLITQMVIQHDLPFQFVEWDGFRAFTKYISSDEGGCVSKDTVIADVMKVYLVEKEKLKNQLARISGRVCLTCHCWTSATCGYVTLTAHYIDENWKLNIKLLNFFPLEPPHTEFKLSKKVFHCLEEWGIEKKIFSVTLDNASSDANLQNLKMRLCLSNSLLCNGDFFRVKCGAHVLDFIVQEGLKVASVVLHKIRKSLKYVCVSESRMKQFYQYVEEVGGIDNTVGLHLDVSSKWSSTYLMLKSAIKYRPAFKCLRSNDMHYRHYPSDEEWARGETTCELLWLFNELTNMISESTYLTSTTYFKTIWKILIFLKHNKLSKDLMIRDMASKMMGEFHKYLSEHSMIFAFGCVLDPRLKFQYLKCMYSILDSNIEVVEEKLRNVRKALDALFSEYTNKCISTSTFKREGKKTFYEEFLEYEEKERQKAYAAGKTQLDLYLEEPTQDLLDDLKVLDYWNNTAYSLGDLAMMARDILSIPIITVSSNSAFSIGGGILNKYKSCKLSKNLQALICSRNWLFGFSQSQCDQCGDVIEETRKVDINLYKQGSNVTVSDESENED